MSKRSCTLLLTLIALLLACGETQPTAIAPSISVSTPSGNRLDSLEFGGVPLGGHTDRAFAIHAESRTPLQVRSVEFESEDGTSAAAFSLLDSERLPLGIPALQQQQLSIRFSPTELRIYEATAVVRSNDPARPAVRIPLVGEGTAGRIEVIACLQDAEAQGRCAEGTRVTPPEPLDLGEVVEGAHAAALVLMRNGGADTLTVERIAFTDPEAAEAAGFVLPDHAGRKLTLPTQEATQLVVDLLPPEGSAGPAEVTLRIETDAVEDPVVEVPLTARVVPNRAPEACLFVRELRKPDGTVEELEPGDELPTPEPGDVLLLDAAARAGCSGDPEDGDQVTLEWTITSPQGRSLLEPVQGVSTQRTLEIDAIGEYVVELLVRDTLGLEASADADGNPAKVDFLARPLHDVAVELSWPDAPQVDVDLHLVRSSEPFGLIGGEDDLYARNRNHEWGEPGPFDDPLFPFDDRGTGPLVETAMLHGAEAGMHYLIYAHFLQDNRLARNQAATCDDARPCGGELVCSAGRCMAPVPVSLRVFLRGEEVDLGAIPGFDGTAVLNTPCDTWFAGYVTWPADGGTAHFQAVDPPIARTGLPENASAFCNLHGTP